MSNEHRSEWRFWGLTLLASILALPCLASAADRVNSKVHPALTRQLNEGGAPVKAWVFFADKGVHSAAELTAAAEQVSAAYNPRAAQRRALRGDNARRGGALFDEQDLPVVPAYVGAVTATGARVHVVSRWVNAVSVYADRAQLDEIARLPFVSRLQPVARAARKTPPPATVPVEVDPPDSPPPTAEVPDEGGLRSISYGASQSQLVQMNLIALHDAGYTASGVIVGMLDSGFHRAHVAFNDSSHPLNVIAEYDFVNNDANTDIETGDPSGQADHGTMTLSCLGAYKLGQYVGGAYNASFILCKTEDTSQEVPAEEDNYVAGLEFIEAHGGDMVTSSLGYIDWYTQADLDGQTAVTTLAVNIATANGLHCCNAAGNEYHDTNPSVAHLIAPADAFQVITCGAVDSSGAIASFSSDGPTADGRVKPELLARGVSASVVSTTSTTSYTTADGTSFATPLTACVVACLIQARPYWTPDQMRAHLFDTADYYVANGTFDPLYIRGYGIVNAFAAWRSCPQAGTVLLDRSEYLCTSTATITVEDCGLNANDLVIETVNVTIRSTSEPAGEVVTLTETASDSAEFVGSIPLSTTNAAGVLWVAENNTVTVTYIDANNGAGGTNVVVTDTAIVDCTPPQITNVLTTNIQPRSATATFTTDEPTRGTVHYGLACGALTGSAGEAAFTASHAVNVSNLTDNTTYFYTVEAEDEAGNVATSDNGGACYTFTTPEVPDFFTELFSGANDLDNFTLTFTPNGSNDFYAGCAESISSLPTDPTGGTALSFSPSADDGYATVTLSGAALVSLYGTTYSTFYPVTNGYLCFVHGETGYNETYADHFGGVPKISALFDDLNPGSGGSVTWKQLADRAAVTWLNVPEYNQSTTNTFQIEMFFDGKITLSYLALAATDGLAGLSKGTGLDPDFLPTDLTTMGACGPQPPQAQNGSAGTAVATPVTVTLHGTDDGLPNPPGALSFGIASLPAHGSLTDPGAGVIGSVPTALTGNQVVYTPAPGYAGADSFTFTANDGGTPPEGGDSAPATVSLNVGGAAWNPVAYNGSASTAISLAVEVTLSGSDPNGDPLTYEIVSLPASGYLSDPGAGAITAVPYTLVSGGRGVTYQPPCGQALSDSFTFRVHDATAGSNVATVAVTVNASGARRVYHFPLDTNPGWTTQGAWAFGPPTGGGTHHLDPSAGYTGTNVYGYNLAGDYTNNLTAKYLTTTALNCANLTNTQLRFRRWLGVEKTDRATVEVSNNGTTWTTLWQNPTTANVSDAAWSQQVFDLTAYADGQATVYVRWGMGPTDGGVTFPGWNVDDVEVWAEVPLIASDFNGDGLVTLGDFAILNECLAGLEGGLAPACLCVDLDADGDVDLADFAEFQESVNF